MWVGELRRGISPTQRWGVRTKTVVASVAVVAVWLAVLGVGLVVGVERVQIAAIDRSLNVTVSAVSTLARSGHLPAVLSMTPSDADFVQVISSNGRVIASSPGIAGEPPLFSVPPHGPISGFRTVSNLPVGNGAGFRVNTALVSTPSGPIVILAGASLDTVSQSIVALQWGLGVVGPLVLVVLGGAVWWLVGRALATVEGLREEVAAIAAGTLDRRVNVPPVGDEVGRLAITMNAMLDRIEQSDQVRRTFISDASHELKSPLAAAQAELEIGLAHVDSVDWPGAARAVLGDVERVRRIVEDLLTLTRLDERVSGVRQPVDLDELVLNELSRLRRTSSRTLDGTGVSAARIDGDPEQLRRVVRNLVDNAVTHAQSLVTVNLGVLDGVVSLRVHDDGSGIALADRERIFERFTRLDEARARSVGGSGLGLAIVAEIVRAHGGAVTVADDGPGTTFVVTLPGSA